MKYPTFILCIFAGLMFNQAMAEGTKLHTDTLTVVVEGTNVDARFEPALLQINPGDVIRFVVREGLHTITAYHPDNRRILRMPESAESFDSGPLTKGDIWYLTITEPGVYDYFCLPHEKMGHAGRIISGSDKIIPEYSKERVPEAVLQKLAFETKQFFKINK